MLAFQFIGIAASKPRRPRVLVAEDHGFLRRAIRVALERDGYDVLEASNAEELVASIEASQASGEPAPDLILSDQGMPGASGLDVLLGLREAQWPLPFILMSAQLDARTEAEAYRLGARAVLEKPFDLQQLRRVVREALTLEPESAHTEASRP
jgi:CheY-like chemotaxis protein